MIRSITRVKAVSIVWENPELLNIASCGRSSNAIHDGASHALFLTSVNDDQVEIKLVKLSQSREKAPGDFCEVAMVAEDADDAGLWTLRRGVDVETNPTYPFISHRNPVRLESDRCARRIVNLHLPRCAMSGGRGFGLLVRPASQYING